MGQFQNTLKSEYQSAILLLRLSVISMTLIPILIDRLESYSENNNAFAEFSMNFNRF